MDTKRFQKLVAKKIPGATVEIHSLNSGIVQIDVVAKKRSFRDRVPTRNWVRSQFAGSARRRFAVQQWLRRALSRRNGAFESPCGADQEAQPHRSTTRAAAPRDPCRARRICAVSLEVTRGRAMSTPGRSPIDGTSSLRLVIRLLRTGRSAAKDGC